MELDGWEQHGSDDKSIVSDDNFPAATTSFKYIQANDHSCN